MPARTPCLCMLLLAGWSSVVLAAAAGDPYEAYVVTDLAEVVAGPGHRFYTTARLPRGTKVEIYREEASGWLAIRPPEGSFSWTPAECIERLDDNNLGKVTEPTAAWVGTSVEQVSEHQEQVQLQVGELVQIVSEKTTVTRSGGERTWLKIAPPAGEYRWVHLRDVSRQKPAEQPQFDVAVGSPADTQQALPLSQSAQANEEPRRLELAGKAIALRSIDEPAARFDRRVSPAQYRNHATVNESRAVSPDGFVPRQRRDNDPSLSTNTLSRASVGPSAARPRLESEARLASIAPAASPRSTAASSAHVTSGLSADQINRQLDQIEVELSLLVAQDRSQWNLAPLERRVQSLVETGADPTSRGRARLLLDKIKQFDKAFAAASDAPRPPAGRQAASSAEQQTPSLTSALADPRYDAQGVLKEVISRKSAKPAAPFAVVDAEGQPVCFVSPSPGLNLNRYLNKPVGLYGRRGYLEELKKPHVVAERIIELDSRWR
jgi:hypothetical protein